MPNAGRRRLDEYTPFPDPRFGGGGGESYLRFLDRTARPLVESAFRVRADGAGNGLVGASLGGLISLYGHLSRPARFGACAAMSPSLFFAEESLFELVAQRPYTGGRIWLDVGTAEGRRRGRGAPARSPSPAMRRLRRLRRRLESRGWRRDLDLALVEESEARHEEAAWAARLEPALRHLFGALG